MGPVRFGALLLFVLVFFSGCAAVPTKPRTLQEQSLLKTRCEVQEMLVDAYYDLSDLRLQAVVRDDKEFAASLDRVRGLLKEASEEKVSFILDEETMERDIRESGLLQQYSDLYSEALIKRRYEVPKPRSQHLFRCFLFVFAMDFA